MPECLLCCSLQGSRLLWIQEVKNVGSSLYINCLFLINGFIEENRGSEDVYMTIYPALSFGVLKSCGAMKHFILWPMCRGSLGKCGYLARYVFGILCWTDSIHMVWSSLGGQRLSRCYVWCLLDIIGAPGSGLRSENVNNGRSRRTHSKISLSMATRVWSWHGRGIQPPCHQSSLLGLEQYDHQKFRRCSSCRTFCAPCQIGKLCIWGQLHLLRKGCKGGAQNVSYPCVKLIPVNMGTVMEMQFVLLVGG